MGSGIVDRHFQKRLLNTFARCSFRRHVYILTVRCQSLNGICVRPLSRRNLTQRHIRAWPFETFRVMSVARKRIIIGRSVTSQAIPQLDAVRNAPWEDLAEEACQMKIGRLNAGFDTSSHNVCSSPTWNARREQTDCL